jgi:ABC-type branched-subunit amino acid transport system substrate-binding protein
VILSAALLAAGCGSSSSTSSSSATTPGSGSGTAKRAANLPPVTAVSSPDCGPIVYEGSGKPDVLVPIQQAETGFGKSLSDPITGVIRQYFKDHQYKAGQYNVALQFCNDATTSAGFTDPAKCAQLAAAYASNPSVVVVGGYDSSTCLQTVTPTLNQAPGGGLTMVSTQATYVCMVVGSPSTCKSDEPKKYYPSGKQTLYYALPPDNYTGSAFGQLMKQKGVKSVYVLSHNQPYGLGLAKLAAAAAKKLGIKVAKQEIWDAKATSYRALMERVKASGADAMVVSGYPSDNAAQLMKDRQAVLGDGFPTFMASTFLENGFLKAEGTAGKGAFIMVESQPPDQLTGDAKAFFDKYTAAHPTSNISALGAYPSFGLATSQLISAAIAGSDGTRAGLVASFPKVKANTVYGPNTGFTPHGALTPPPPAGHFEIKADGTVVYGGKVSYPADLPNGL